MSARGSRIARRRGQYAAVEQFLEGVRQRQQKADREQRTNDLIDQERRSMARMLEAIGRDSQ